MGGYEASEEPLLLLPPLPLPFRVLLLSASQMLRAINRERCMMSDTEAAAMATAAAAAHICDGNSR